jgi:hypothetical protein
VQHNLKVVIFSIFPQTGQNKNMFVPTYVAFLSRYLNWTIMSQWCYDLMSKSKMWKEKKYWKCRIPLTPPNSLPPGVRCPPNIGIRFQVHRLGFYIFKSPKNHAKGDTDFKFHEGYS